MSGAEIAENVFLGIAPLLRADDHHLVRSEAGKSADDRPVFRIQAVAVQFAKICEGGLQIIQAKRALWMASDLDPVPGAEVREDLALRLFELLLDHRHFLLEADVEGVGFRMFL